MNSFKFDGTVFAREVFQMRKGGKIITLIFHDVKTSYVPIKFLWDLADTVADVKKGDNVQIVGHLGGREYDGKYYSEIIADSIEVAGKTENKKPETAPSADDDDVPF
jgi:hypothetical protein